MPRTSAVECPGCPPIRALTFDSLGLIKVIEARSGGGGTQLGFTPKVVERWGEPDSSKAVLAASINDRQFDPLLAVARKNGRIEVLNPLNGEIRVAEQTEVEGDDNISGLHLFKKESSEISSRSCALLSCTVKGNAILRSLELGNSITDSSGNDSRKIWSVCSGGNILCTAVDGSEKYALFGGKGVELNIWDLETITKTWNAKSPRKNSLDIFTPTWFSAATYLNKDDHRKIVAGTNDHQVRLYDVSAQRRPVISVDFRESAIKSVTEDLDGYTIYLGTGSGDLASVDMRTGKLLGCFVGKCSGSIRSIVRHPELPVIASCGLDSYLRFWDIKTRQLLSAVFLKQHLTKVVIDSNFSDKETVAASVGQPPNEVLEKHTATNEDDDEEEDDVSARKKMKKRSREEKKLKQKKEKVQIQQEDEDEDELINDELIPVKRKKTSGEREQSKKLKSNKKKPVVRKEEDDDDDDAHAPMPVVKKKSLKEGERTKKPKTKKKKQV